MSPTFTFTAELWLYSGEGAWYFITLPREIAEDIRLIASSLERRGFGSLKVTATIDNIAWETSIFPDSKSKSYLLPVKKAVRVQAGIAAGDKVQIDVVLKHV